MEPDDLHIPARQQEATHPLANLRVRADGKKVVVEPLHLVAEPDRTPQADMPRWHRAQADDSTKAKQWYAVSFHLERLVRLQPWDASLRPRLKEALKQAPDSPASQAVRRRLTEHDVARHVLLITAASNPWTVLPLLPLGSAR